MSHCVLKLGLQAQPLQHGAVACGRVVARHQGHASRHSSRVQRPFRDQPHADEDSRPPQCKRVPWRTEEESVQEALLLALQQRHERVIPSSVVGDCIDEQVGRGRDAPVRLVWDQRVQAVVPDIIMRACVRCIKLRSLDEIIEHSTEVRSLCCCEQVSHQASGKGSRSSSGRSLECVDGDDDPSAERHSGQVALAEVVAPHDALRAVTREQQRRTYGWRIHPPHRKTPTHTCSRERFRYERRLPRGNQKLLLPVAPRHLSEEA